MEKNKTQIVYLFRQKGTEHVKIGMTAKSDFSDRFSHFSMYSPNGAEVVGVIKCLDSRAMEKEIHSLYKHKRLKGEFFNLSKEDCDFILKKYNSNDEVDKLINKIKIISNTSGADFTNKLNAFLNSYNFTKNETKSYQSIIDLFEEDLNAFYTSTEISEILKEKKGIDIKPINVGLIISKKFKPISKRRGKNVSRCYQVKLVP